MTTRCVLAATVALASIACDHPETIVTAPTELTVFSQLFQGSLGVQGTRFFSFTVSKGGTVSFMLASVTDPATGAATNVTVGLGMGIPAGTGCGLSQSIATTASLRNQLSMVLTPGIYCVSVYDVGDLGSSVNFALRFTHP